MKTADAILLKTCQAVETRVEKGFEKSLVNQLSEIKDNKAFLQENLESKKERTSNENNWIEDDFKKKKKTSFLAFDATNAKSNYAKEKLIGILKRDILIPKQC